MTVYIIFGLILCIAFGIGLAILAMFKRTGRVFPIFLLLLPILSDTITVKPFTLQKIKGKI